MPKTRMAGSFNPFGAMLTGLNKATGEVATNFSLGNAVRSLSEMAYEALPGNQKTSMDYSQGERFVNTAQDVTQGANLANTAVRNQTGVSASKFREKGLEAAGKRGLVSAGKFLGSRLPAIGAKFAAGTAASGGVMAPVMAVVGAGDLLNVGVEAVTGRGILDHAQNPEPVRGRYGAKKAAKHRSK